jgi:cysteinyl-tRNA synthetase
MKQAAAAVLELDKMIWQAQQDAESPEFISQARDMMRDMVVLMAAALEAAPKNREECLDPLVRELLALRKSFRENKLWKEADAIRDSLLKADILVEDTAGGARWRLKP